MSDPVKASRHYRLGEKAELWRRHEAGASVPELAEAFGRSEWAIYMVLHWLRKSRGIVPARQRLLREPLPTPTPRPGPRSPVWTLTRAEALAQPCPACGGPRRTAGILASCVMCGRTTPLVDGDGEAEARLLGHRGGR